MYGAQTSSVFCFHAPKFENDVEMYGAQTYRVYGKDGHRLRMM